MKHIRLKDPEGEILYPATKWELIENLPSNTILGVMILQAISGYDASKSQTLKNDHGTFQWIDD